MKRDWKRLLQITGGRHFMVTQVSIPSEDIVVSGEFELSPLGKLDESDQLFVSVFIQTHGSIKQMEKVFGISYPTVKNRLNQISKKLNLIDFSSEITLGANKSNSLILDQLEKGEIDVETALKELE